MKVLNFTRPENGLIHDPIYHFGFENYELQAKDCYLFMADYQKELLSGKYEDKYKLALDFEEPNACVGGENGIHALATSKADKVLTLCPYTAKIYSNREFVFFPFNEKFIRPEQNKVWDIVYTGSIPRYIPWEQYLSLIKKYNYRDAYYTRGTNPSCTYLEKIKLYAESKIALVHCLCSPSIESKGAYLSYPGASKNEALSHLDQGIMPQMKSRIMEAAFHKSLILCWKDPWGIIENFFEAEKEFLYFTDLKDLHEKIESILNNYDSYRHITEAAYIKAVNNYTTKHFVEKFIGLTGQP